MIAMCYNRVMVNRLIKMSSLIALAVMMVMLNFTTPAEVGPLGVLVFFTTVYIVVLGVASGLVALFYKITKRKTELGRKDYYYAAALGFGPILVLLVLAFGSLSLWTGALIVLFEALVCLIVNKKL